MSYFLLTFLIDQDSMLDFFGQVSGLIAWRIWYKTKIDLIAKFSTWSSCKRFGEVAREYITILLNLLLL